jgi:hypothetical protein
MLRHGILVLNLTSSTYRRLQVSAIRVENVREDKCKYG